MDTEKWRKEFGGGVDNFVSNWHFPEKQKLAEYYQQYYHKTDKVSGAQLPWASLHAPRTEKNQSLTFMQDGRPVYIEHVGKVNVLVLARGKGGVTGEVLSVSP